jgi:predicted transcriptional regulator
MSGKVKRLQGEKTDQKVLEFLKKSHPIDRNSLSKEIGIPRSTLYDSLKRLWLKGKIKKREVPKTTKGRRKVVYEVV